MFKLTLSVYFYAYFALFLLLFNRLIAAVLRLYLIVFVLGLFYYRIIIYHYYYFIYNAKFNVYAILIKALQKNFVFSAKVIRLLNFTAYFDKYKFISGTFISLFITFLNVFLYVPNKLCKYYVYLSFKFLVIFVTFNFSLYYTVTLKFIINRIIIVYNNDNNDNDIFYV